MNSRPTEKTIVQACAAIVTSAGLISKIVPRWILGLEPGEAIPHLAAKDGSNDLLPINAWVMTISAWIPAKVKSEKGYSETPKNFVEGFTNWGENPGGDPARGINYKINVNGSIKIWQVMQYEQGNNTSNSEYTSMDERQLVIDKITANPRLGLECADFEHDELKFPAIVQIPFNGSLLHVAQGNIPFSFSYVVTAT
jgi:hypothetical protein